MKESLLILFLFVGMHSYSQNFSFEDSEVPSEWRSSASGSLSLSAEHYKDGFYSLCWSTKGIAALTVSFDSFIANNSNSAYFQIYSTQVSNDTLIVEFLNANSVKKKALYLVNYKGWREFNRSYVEYASTLSSGITAVRFTLKPTDLTSSRRLYFDNVNFNAANSSKRIVGSQWLLDRKYFNSSADTSSLALYANVIDMPVVEPTTAELSDLQSLRVKHARQPKAGTTTELNAAKLYASSFNIVRNSDGTVRGNAIDCSADALTDAFMIDLSNKLQVLAADAMKNVSTKALLLDFVDHLLDQGIAEGCNYRTFSNSYNACRVVPAAWLDVLTVCKNDQKEEILKLVRWFSYYGTLYYSPELYLSKLVSDVVYLFLPHMLAVALNYPDDAVSVRELKAFKRYLDRNTEYVPGGEDIFKPDGTGFHHWTHYNNYMYAYKTWVQHMYYLKGSSFRVSTDAYQRFKKAIISLYLMGTVDTADARYFANSLCGRKPFDLVLQFSKANFENLVEIGTDCYGVQDDEVAAAYNYFFQSSKYTVSPKLMEGFFQFNYSPMGVYRKDNWVVTMRSPTTNFFGAEIYDNQNRFGRYQANGTLEVLYNGSLTENGYPSSSATSGGWDWNVVPGATTVHYNSWQDMMPYKSTTGRFDQKTKTKNFAGALAFDECGVFSADFDQLDTWSSTAYNATNLAYKKTMFAIDKMIFSIGSSISSSGSYNSSMVTATNLFQVLNPELKGNVLVNGSAISNPFNQTFLSNSDNWILTPQGTGYFVPKGNDALQVKLQNQSSPVHSGADFELPSTNVSAVKAFLNHGVKPSLKSYSFIVVPGATKTSMELLSSKMANGGDQIYKIHAQSNSLHAISYLPLSTTAYSFFGPVNNLSFGIIKASTDECLLIDKYDSATNRHRIAVCNPNLNPAYDATYKWLATQTQTTLTFEGEWAPVKPVMGVEFYAPTMGQTQVRVQFNEGEPIFFELKSKNEITDIEIVKKKEWVQFLKQGNELDLMVSENNANNLHLKVFAANGALVYANKYSADSKLIRVDVSRLNDGLHICILTDGMRSSHFKWIN